MFVQDWAEGPLFPNSNLSGGDQDADSDFEVEFLSLSLDDGYDYSHDALQVSAHRPQQDPLQMREFNKNDWFSVEHWK